MDEQNVIKEFIAGDVKAFEKIFYNYSRELYFVALGLCRDQALAEDAVQECFVYLWSHRTQLNITKSFENYLVTMVKNLILNHLRHLRVAADREEDIVREIVFANTEEEEDFSSKLDVVRELIDSLPESCRKVFVMTVIEGSSYADTAKNLGIAVNTVKSQVRIAYKKIRDAVKNGTDNDALVILFLLLLKKML
ncbi:RNA polymerase sigma-70 factor [Odoribacter sp. AF15-53]|nr:RNA polymerase sigma-70 factor [Odoribacter sp. AF15-53]